MEELEQVEMVAEEPQQSEFREGFRKEQTTGQMVGFSVVGLLVLLGFSYLELVGWMYMTMGNALVSLALTGGLALVISATSFLLPRIWSSNAKFVSKRRSLLMTVDSVVFGLAMLVAFIGVNHFAKVYNDRDVIAELYDNGIAEARNLYPTYDAYVKARCDAYNQTLQEAVRIKAKNVQFYQEVVGKFPGANDATRINNLIASLRRTLQPTNDNLQSDFSAWLDHAGKANLWNISFASNVTVMDRKVTTCIAGLSELSGRFFHPGEEHKVFEYPQYASNDQLQALLSTTGFYYSWKSLLILLFTVFTLVMPVLRSDLRSRKDI